MMTRRSAFETLAVTALAQSAQSAAPLKGRLKQSVCRWCYSKMSLDDLCQAAARIGLKGIDLVDYKEWPTVQKYGLVPSMTPGGGTIADALNRTENHARLEREFRENIGNAAKSGVPNVITFSGNRRGMSDEIAKDNCVTGLNRVKRIAEDHGVTICLELLNSKVDHHDYQCDHTAWGVEVIKRVDSPRKAAVRHLSHADHGRRRDPHYPR
jgi:hydroxypyruvate isomerase